jgi:hypothetical protein
MLRSTAPLLWNIINYMKNKGLPNKAVLYITPGWDVWIRLINSLESQFGYTPSGIVCANSNKVRAGLKNQQCIIYDEGLIKEGKSVGRSILDEGLLSRLEPHLNITLKMISRYYPEQSCNTYSKQKEIYRDILSISYQIFQESKPDVVISASPPHRVYDYLIRQLCVINDIEFIAYESTSIDFLSYFTNSKEVNFPYGRAASNNIALSDKVKKIMMNLEFGSYEDIKPCYSSPGAFFKKHEEKKKFPINKLLRLGKLFSLWKKPMKGYLTISQGFMLNTRYPYYHEWLVIKIRSVLRMNLIVKPYYSYISKFSYQLTDPYILFTANYQPERSTVPDGGNFWDYDLAIGLLHDSIPSGWKIVYKEHPRTFKKDSDWDIDRNLAFYMRLRQKYNNLIFIKNSEDILNLIDSSEVVSSISSTSIWEAVMRKKKAILFGYQWLENMPGVYQVKNVEQCINAINTGKTENFDEEKIVEYMSLLEVNCLDLSDYKKYTASERYISHRDNSISKNEVLKTLLNSILNALQVNIKK